MKNKIINLFFILASFIAFTANGSENHKHVNNHHQHSKHSHKHTIDDLFNNTLTPFAIGHRGYGNNLGENSDKPIENTIPSIRKAYDSGIQIVEVDVSVTADGKAIVLHDDYLEDLTCINTLSYKELITRVSTIPTLIEVLETAKSYSKNHKQNSEHQSKRKTVKETTISGLLSIEIKTPSPMCDPHDTTEFDLAKAVITAIDKTKMQQQVIIESFSPLILNKISALAPEIPRNLTMSAVQFLSKEQVEAFTGLPVTLINKQAGFGLQWAEIGAFYRLPGYLSIDQYFLTVHLADIKVVALDMMLLKQTEQVQPGSALAIVNQLKNMGVTVTAYTVENQQEWQFLESLGVDGIFTNDIPMGVAQQNQ